MIEPFFFSFGPVIVNKLIGGLYDIKTYMFFLLFIIIYTYAYLYYRCKIKTKEKQPIKFTQLIYAILPILIYVVVLFSINIILSYKFIPQLLLFYTLLSTPLALWIISFFFYYPSVRISHGNCFPSLLKGFTETIKNLFN